MADNTCPLCGKRLRGGYCEDCGGGMSASCEDKVDAQFDRQSNMGCDSSKYTGYTGEFAKGGRAESLFNTYTDENGGSTAVSEYTSGDGRRNTTVTERRSPSGRTTYKSTVTRTTFGNSNDYSAPAGNTVFTEPSQPDDTDGIPLSKLIFSKKHIWKFIIALIWGFAGMLIGVFSIRTGSKENRRVGTALLIFSVIMFIVMPFASMIIPALFNIFGDIISGLSI